MSALQQLREQVAQQQAERRAAEEARRQQAIEQFRARLTEVVGEDVLAELQAEFGLDGSWPQVTFHYRGAKKAFTDGYPQDICKRVVAWMEKIDTEIQNFERERGEARESLLAALPQIGGEWDLHRARVKAERYKLLDDAEIAPALEAAEERLKEAAARAEEERRQAAEAQIAELLDQLDVVQEWSELASLRDQIDYNDYPEVPRDRRIVEALEATRGRLEARDQERERRRLEAQAQAFYPFCYYRVYYGIVAFDGDDSYLDVEHIDCLRPEPSESGWWYPANGNSPVWVAHLVKVERIEVREPDQMPYWCPQQDTGWGIIRVPPGEAERL